MSEPVSEPETYVGIVRHRPEIGQSATEATTPDQMIEWLLRAIACPGDMNQRRYDLESLAKLVTEHPDAGYGVQPIDNDTHPEDCVNCKPEQIGEPLHEYHPYRSTSEGPPTDPDALERWLDS